MWYFDGPGCINAHSVHIFVPLDEVDDSRYDFALCDMIKGNESEVGNIDFEI